MTMTQPRPEATTTESKPRLRGWFHLGSTPLVIVGGILLMVLSPTVASRVGAAVWLAGSVLLFGTSAAYHLVNWSPRTKAVFRRWDHANIFAFIAATYTPIALALLPDPTIMLVVIWSIAVAGMAVQISWPTAPRWLNVACYLGMGWAGVGWLPEFWVLGGPAVVILILLGGVAYSLGAVVYARKWPDPSPTWFGFHEIFHAFTVIAAACHFAAISVAIFA